MGNDTKTLATTEPTTKPTPPNGSKPLANFVIQGLRYAIADAILHQAKTALESKEGIEKTIEENKETLNKATIDNSNRDTTISTQETAAHTAVVNKINAELVGNNAENTQAQLLKDVNNLIHNIEYTKHSDAEFYAYQEISNRKKAYGLDKPKTIPELLRIKHELLFQKTLEEKTKGIKSAKEIRKIAVVLHKKADEDYINELRQLVLDYHAKATDIKNTNTEAELRTKLAGLVGAEKNNEDNKTISEAIAKAKKDKETLESDQNWIDRAVHQAMFFALSCGTTMAGALLLLISDLVPLWLFAGCVFVSPLFVLWVTKANWWLTVNPMAHVTLEFVKLWRLDSDKRKKELEKYHKGWLAAFFISSIAASIIWGIFTYDATIELMLEIGKKFSEIPGFSALGLAWFLGVTFALKGIYDVYHGAFVEKRFNSKVIQIVRGLLFLASAALTIAAIITASPSIATAAIATVFSLLMGLYTAPTIFAIFFYVGKERLGLIKKIEHNDYDKFQNKLEDNLKYVDDKHVNKYYRVFAFAFVLVIAALCTLFSPFVAEWLINAGLITDKNTSLIQTAVSGVMMAVSGVMGWAFLSRERTNVAKANFSLYVLGLLAIWCGLTGLLASVPLTTNLYMSMGEWTAEWTGLGGEKSSTIAAYATILGLGGLSAAWFYFSSGVGTILKFFSKQDLFSDAESLKNNPVGINQGPNFDKVTAQVAYEHRNGWDKFVDGCRWVGSWIWPFSNDKDSYFYTVVILNGGLNATSNAYGAYSAYSVKENAATVFGIGNCATGFIAGFAGSTAGNFNNTITPIVSKLEEIKLTKELYTTLVANNIGALAYLYGTYYGQRDGEESNCFGCLSIAGSVFGYTAEVKKAAATNMKHLLEGIENGTVTTDNVSDSLAFNKNSTSTEKLTCQQWEAAKQGRMGGLYKDACNNETVSAVFDVIDAQYRVAAKA